MKLEDFTNGEAIDFQRGYAAYEQEIARVGAAQARRNLIRRVAQHVANVRGGAPEQPDNMRQVELVANAFFAAVPRYPFAPFARHELTKALRGADPQAPSQEIPNSS